MMTAELKVKTSAPDGKPTITLEREFDAPPALVFRAYTDAEAMKQWYGPNGFTISVIAMDFRVGGLFRFTMHGPDGTDWSNRIEYQEILPGKRLAYRHGSDKDNDSDAFQVVITFEALVKDRTRLISHMTLPSVEARNAVMKFGAVELGAQTLEKLAAYLSR